jgi:hypothetical protein
MFAERGGTNAQMHQVLDGLTPTQAVTAVAAVFTGWHLHKHPQTGWLWADTDMLPIPGPPVSVHAADAEGLYREMAAAEHMAALLDAAPVTGRAA